MSPGSKSPDFNTMMYVVSKHASWWNAWFLLGHPKLPCSSMLAEGGASRNVLVLSLVFMSLPMVASERYDV